MTGARTVAAVVGRPPRPRASARRRRSRSRSGSASAGRPTSRAIAKAGADGVIVASALVDALGPDGRDVDRLTRLVRELRGATARATTT